MNVNHRSKYPGTAYTVNTVPCESKTYFLCLCFLLVFIYFLLLHKKHVFFWWRECYISKVATADVLVVNLCFAVSSINLYPKLGFNLDGCVALCSSGWG